MLRLLATVALAWLLAVPARAEPAPANPADAQGVARQLARIHQAAHRINYHGTFVVSAAGMLSSTRIVHYCEGKNQVERIEPLDGQPRQVLRRNEVLHTLWPASRQRVIERREVTTSFPALLQADGTGVDRHYTLEVLGTDRVAGHAADVIELKPRDSHRFGYRLWSEKASALLLRADVIGPGNEVLESTTFTDVEIGVKPRADAVLARLRNLDGWRVSRQAATAAHLEAEGWALRAQVPGFRQIACVKRAIDPQAAEPVSEQALHAVWSDGLGSVSIFIERYRPQRHARELQATLGAMHTLQRKRGDWWITVVGEVPATTLRQFANALERRRP